MTDEKVAESVQEQPEVEEQPSPRAPSVPSEDKPTSQPKAGADGLDRLEKLVEQAVARKSQSLKDKRIAKLEKQIQSLLEGEDTESVSQPDPGRSKVAEPQADEPTKVMAAISAQVLSGKGIEFDDPEYEAFVSEHAWVQSPENWRTLVQAWADRQSTKVAKQSSATMASRVSGGGSPAPAEGDAESIAEELAAIQRGEHGSPFKQENQNRINELIARLNEIDPMMDVNDPNLHIDTSNLHRVV